MARQETASTIINDTAIEVGLIPVSDPYSSQDAAFQQLVGLLNSAGRELVDMFSWEMLQNTFSLTTQIGDTGTYDLPDDFHHMINQTGWNETARVPVGGPLSPQQWAFAVGGDWGSTTLYVNFILNQNKLVLYPAPPPPDVVISFNYISRNWVTAPGGATADRATGPSDTIMFPPILMVKFLKVKFLSAKGFDIAVASRDFDMTFDSATSQNRGAPILSANGRRGFPYLNGWTNIPFTGFGL